MQKSMCTFPVYEVYLNILRMLFLVYYVEIPSGYLVLVCQLDFESKGVFLQDDTGFNCKLVRPLEKLVMRTL